MLPGQPCKATWTHVLVTRKGRGVWVKGARLRLILSPPGDTWQCQATLLVVTPGEGVAVGIQWAGPRDAAAHPTAPRTAPRENELPQTSVVPGLRYLLQAVCVNAPGGWGECVACE